MTFPTSDAAPYAVWEETLQTLADTGGVTLILGGTDVGKTTFTRQLVNRGVMQGRRVAIVDADIGQSEIGPPTCAGLGITEKPLLALSDLPPRALAFVGSLSPPGYLLEYAVAIRRLTDMALSEMRFEPPRHRDTEDSQRKAERESTKDTKGHEEIQRLTQRRKDARLTAENASGREEEARPLVIVDTCGYLHGSAARRLNQVLFDLVAPANVVALQRDGEVEAILAPLRQRDNCRIFTPPIPESIGKKPPSFRAQRRAMRFSAYFQEAKPYTYAFDEVALMGTWLGGGTPIAAHLLKFLNQSLGPRVRVYYAEMAGRHLGLMVSQPTFADSSALSVAQAELKAQSVSLTVAPRLKHLVLGLEGANGKLLGLGLLEAIDFRRRTLGVVTPVRAPGAARILRFGGLRVMPDGSEVGSLKPGELA